MTQVPERLHHVTHSNKYRDWRKHRNQALALSMAYRSLGPDFQKKADRVFSCARRIDLSPKEPGEIGQSVLNRYGCKDRLCPGCQSSRGRRNFMELYQVYEQYHKANPSEFPAMLTLTVPNMYANQSQEALTELLSGFRRLTRRKAFHQAVNAWFRALEVTYNAEKQTYHPHIHTLLMLQPKYFDKDQDFYLQHHDWLVFWQKVMKRQDIKHLDIRLLRPHPADPNDRTMSKAIAELAKYATKPADIFIPTRGGGYTVNARVIHALHLTLKCRRLIAYSKSFKDLRAELPATKFQPREDDDMDIYLWEDEPDGLLPDYYRHQGQCINNGNISNERK